MKKYRKNEKTSELLQSQEKFINFRSKKSNEKKKSENENNESSEYIQAETIC